MPNLWDLISKDEQIQSGLEALKGAGRGAARGLTTDAVGAIPDAVASAMNAVGIPVGDNPTGGSKWMRQLLNQPTEDTPAELVGNLLSSFTSPGKAGMDIAGLAPMLAGVFVGPKSKTWNKGAADYFEAVEKNQYLTPQLRDSLWQQMGTFRSPGDKMLRQEIPDQASKLKVHGGQQGKLNLEEVLEHPELFEAYPQLRGTQVDLIPAFADQSGASYMAPYKKPGEAGYIEFNPNSATAREDLLHEVQHAIQRQEDFARGGSVEGAKEFPEFAEFKKKMLKEGVDDERIARIIYTRLAGETEARLVSERARMDPALLGVHPKDMMDVPTDKLITKYYTEPFMAKQMEWLKDVLGK